MKVSALLLLVIAATSGYAATDDQQDARLFDEQVLRAASVLAGRSDADSLAAAAALTRLRDPAEAEQLAARASAAAPNRPDLVWLQASFCGALTSCDRKAIETRLRKLDPRNGVTWVSALADARARTDRAEKDRLLEALAITRSVDLYWNPLVAHLSNAIISTGALTASQSVVSVVGVLAATTIPPFKETIALCGSDELQRKGRRAQCQAVARAFQQGDTVIVERIGDRMAGQLWPEDSPEAQAAGEARRVSEYRTSVWGEDKAPLLADDVFATRYLMNLGRYRREQDMMLAEIVAAGHSPTPPADWRPAVPPSVPSPAAP